MTYGNGTVSRQREHPEVPAQHIPMPATGHDSEERCAI